MSNLRIEKLRMPAATLGGENPLPRMTPRLSATAGEGLDESVALEDRKYIGYGLDAGWLPHRGQDDYDRTRVDRDFLALVLENEYLRATFLPEVGGRLWSLVHKPSGKDLLFVNPVFQPANLAVRGAWITGGVEWNPCVYGHSPYTCSSLFAALVKYETGGDVLRLYEWDRTRCVPFQMDFSLPSGSPYLFARMRLVNPHAHTIPMYWWSNITVPESPDVRVIAPADNAYTYEYWDRIHAVSVPRHCDLDITYSTNIPYGADYFFRIPDGARPWIAALDREGRGLVQTSSARQMGRKLFAWGSKTGGRRWQEFLSTPDHAYLEIQAGIARTQSECAPMPAGAEWEWIEAYGYMEAEPAKVHGSDWRKAINAVAERLDRSLPRESLEAQLRQTASLADRSPSRVLHRGSGWGALERHRREKAGEPPFCSPGLVFDDESLGEDQKPWLSLLHDGIFPTRAPENEPGAWMIQEEWLRLLVDSTANHSNDHWLTHLHLGLMNFARGDMQSAEAAWQQSLMLNPSGWAYRNIAVLRKLMGHNSDALSLYKKAHRRLPELRPLIVEITECLLGENQAAEALELLSSLPSHIRDHSRVRLLEARAGLMLGLLEYCQPIFDESYELVDIREGESTLTELWEDFQSQQLSKLNGHLSLGVPDRTLFIHSPLPRRLNFQVVPSPSTNSPLQHIESEFSSMADSGNGGLRPNLISDELGDQVASQS